MGEDQNNIPPAIEKAIKEIESHHTVKQIADVSSGDTNVVVESVWAVNLPNPFKTSGISKTGVKESEQVFWIIPLDYPQRAPSPRLRADFPINLPHINPHRPGDHVHPCVAEIPLEDLLHSSGLGAILNATSQWLNNAAADELHCPVQGWEYVRRDDSTGTIVTDSYSIRGELDSYNKTARFYQYKYFYWTDIEGPLVGSLVTPHLGSANNSYKQKYTGVHDTTAIRNAPGILFQTGPGDVIDEYRPETIADFKGLREFADHLGLRDAFDARLSHILSVSSPQLLQTKNKMAVEEFLVAFAVRRPFNLIGTDSPWELLPYRVRYNTETNGQLTDNTIVKPTSFIERCCPQLLQAVSGIPVDAPINIGLLGCGSLGSKIALHLAKSGRYEFELVDKRVFNSHNNARHGLIVADFDSLYSSKSRLLHRELSHLGIESKSIDKDIREIGKKDGFTLKTKTDYIVDSSASLPVRHFLAHHSKSLPGRFIHTALYGKSTMGIVAVEGHERTVRVDDLMAFTNALCVDNESVRMSMYGSVGPDLNFYGEGCSSVTTTMSDIDISLMAVGISAKIDRFITTEFDTDLGLLYVGLIDPETANMHWDCYKFPPTLLIPRADQFDWDIRVLGNVAEEIRRLSELDTTLENGGVIAGQVCTLTNTIYVTHLIDAPDGSIRSSSEFLLNTDGLPQLFDNIHQSTNGQVTFLGTWHSHTYPCPPSIKDKKSLEMLKTNYDLPIVMLTFTGGNIVRV